MSCVVLARAFAYEGVVVNSSARFIAFDGFVPIVVGPAADFGEPILKGATPEALVKGASDEAMLKGATGEGLVTGATDEALIGGATDEGIIK